MLIASHDPIRALRLQTLLPLLMGAALLAPPVARADISGFVLEEGSGSPGTPIAGARVHVQADPGVLVLSAADGSFTLPINPAGAVTVTAALVYDRARAVNYNTAGVLTFNGAAGVEIRLPVVPFADNPIYSPPLVEDCGGCHGNQRSTWLESNHSFAGTDTWVRDLFSGDGTPGGGAGYVFRDLHDPGETGFCSTCHTPMAEVFDPGNVFLDEVTDPAALQGVTCVACHQMDSVNEDVNALHVLGNATYRFPDTGGFPATEQFVWGPLDDVTFGGMSASYSPLFRESRLCASCHQYTNPDTGAPGQNTYGEWLASPYAVPGPDFRTCQDCHMTPPDAPDTVCLVGGPPLRPPTDVRSHAMEGATPASLAAAIDLTASATDGAGLLTVRAEVTNVGAGHSFPTGVSIRNALLVVTAAYAGSDLPQVGGPTVPFWADDDVAGSQPGDFAGFPGKGFAKILEGRINGAGPVVRPVLFIDAEGVFSDTLIPSGATDVTEVTFLLPPDALPGDVVEVSAQLLYRRAFRALAVTKGWTETPQGGPVEIEVARQDFEISLVGGGQGGTVTEIPTAGGWGLLALALALAAAAVLKLRAGG